MADFVMPLNFSALRWLALVCALLWGVWAPLGAAYAQDHIVERSWLQDPGGQMGLAQVQQQPTQVFQGVLNLGYSTAVVWLRLRIDPHVDAQMPDGQKLVLRIRPAYLDEVQVFDPLANGGLAGVVGDSQHPRLDALQGADFLLPIARGDAPRDLWLRLSTTSTRQIHVEVLQPTGLSMRAVRHNLVASLYLGVVLVLMVWGIVSRALHREGVMGAFALMQATSLLFGLSTLGILRVFWPLDWSAELLNRLGSVFSIVVVVTGLWFQVRFLREFRPARWAMGLLYAMLALSLCNLVLLALGHTVWALTGNIVSILLAPPICLACAVTGQVWRAVDGTPPPAINRPVLVSFYVLFLVIFLLSSTTGLGWVQATEWTMYVSQLHGLVSSMLLMLILQYRNFVQNQQRQQALLTLETTRLQVTHEREVREEQEKLLLMLAHEIKTPLATMHLRLDSQAKGAREIRQAMREMNTVIDRCLQTLKVDGGKLTAYLKAHDFMDVVRDAISACSQPERVQVQAPALLRMHIDAQILFIVLSNLLENACNYSAAETPITLHCQALTDAMPPVLRLELCNWPGRAGWPDAAHVFDKYYRSAKAQRQSGTGLGLYLAQSLVQALGGHISYEPHADQVRFVLVMPLGAGAALTAA